MHWHSRVLAVVLFATCFAVSAPAKTDLQPTNSSSCNETADGNFRPAQPWFGRYATLVPPGNAAPAPSSSDEGFPRVELFGGYSYVRFNVKGPVLHQNFDDQGGTGALAFNVNRWFGIVGDFAGYKVSGLPNGVSGNQFTYLFGPQFSH
ncbi:MAG TPA: hypothetical protein VHN74_18405, partial [Candidatus Angelobacter sp.]|nr:hypothetical protein [Candidatus Angelobacter sp.]